MTPKPPLYNSVLPSKIYDVYWGQSKLGEVQASDVHDAYRIAKEHKHFKNFPIAIILKGKT